MTQSALFSPFTFRNVTLKNRIVLSPMCQYSAVDGAVTTWHEDHHAQYAIGGVGLGFVEATGVESRGRISHGCTGLWSDDQVEPLRRIAAIYHRHGAAAGIQLAHAGRKGSCSRTWDGDNPLTEADAARGDFAWQTVAPSAVRIDESWPVPHPLSVDEIATVVTAWRDAARRADDAGFDVIEIHGAHGYLIHQFLSPIANQREDAYGGTRNKRMRFAVEVVEAIRSVWPGHKPLVFRTSAVDGVSDGWGIEDTVELARTLKGHGVDMIDASSGAILDWIDPQIIGVGPGYQVPFAERVRRDAGIPTMAVGLILQPQQAEAIIADGQADLVALGRTLIDDPYWPLHAAQALGADPESAMWPPQYSGSMRSWYRRTKSILKDQNHGSG